MNREQLIDEIIAQSGANAPPGGRARERLARLSTETLNTMRVEVEMAGAYGRKVNTFTPEQTNDLAALLLASEKASAAWREAVDAWSQQTPVPAPQQTKAAPHTAGSAVVPAFMKYAPKASLYVSPPLSSHWHFSGRAVLAQHVAADLIRQVVYRLAGNSPDERYVERVCFELQRPVSEYLSLHFLKMVSRIADEAIEHADQHRLLDHLDALAVARAEEESRWLSKLSYYPNPKRVGEATVREGLAKAAVCVRELAPTVVIAGPRSETFCEFLDSTRLWYSQSVASPTSAVGQSILVAFESIGDTAELTRVSSLLSEKYPGVPIRGVCLFGTPECSHGVSDLPLWTMVATSGEPVDAPWDSSGGFKVDGERMVFGAGSPRSFEMETGDFKQRVETLIEGDRQFAD